MTELPTPSPARAGSALDAWGLRLAAAVCITAAAWIWWAPALRAIFAPSGIVSVFQDSFTNGTIAPSVQAEVTGFAPCDVGWCLAPGARGTLIYRIPGRAQLPRVEVWFYKPTPGTNRISVSGNGGKSYQTITENARHEGARLELGLPPRPGEEIWLRFDAANDSAVSPLVLDELRITNRSAPAPVLPAARDLFAIVLSFGAAIVVLRRRWALAVTTLLILALGAALRYSAAAELLHATLDPDAGGYRIYADQLRLFTENGFFSGRFGTREPLFILAVHVYQRLMGTSDFGLRMLTVILSTVSIYSVIRVGRGLFGAVPGQVIGLAIALNTPLILESARGLRLELEIILCMAYLGAAFLKPWPKVLPASIVLSVLGALLVLTRMTYLPVVVALNAYAFLGAGDGPLADGLRAFLATPGQWIRTLRPWAIGMIVTVLALAAGVVPHRYGFYTATGDAFFDTAIYARWNANVEFMGRPGFPTSEEFQKNPFAGPRITYGEYMFGMHTRQEIAAGTARGYRKLFARMELCPRRGWSPDTTVCANVNAVFQWLALAGLVIALVMPRYRWITLTFLLIEFPVAFLYDRQLVEPYRHSYSAFPLVLFAAMVPLVLLWTTVVGRLQGPAAMPHATRAA